jgi:hypothetical protein|tara:strand:- start:401 stop:640 length:240 start_codon:yes stop_codon:yes gene_type:complete
MKDNRINRLRILASWLKESQCYIDHDYDGQLERNLKIVKQETKQEIGNYLEEILNMDDTQIEREILNIESNQIKKDLPF